MRFVEATTSAKDNLLLKTNLELCIFLSLPAIVNLACNEATPLGEEELVPTKEEKADVVA